MEVSPPPDSSEIHLEISLSRLRHEIDMRLRFEVEVARHWQTRQTAGVGRVKDVGCQTRHWQTRRREGGR